MQNGLDSSLFCCDTISIQGWSIFFWPISLLLLKKQNYYLKKCAVKAAKSDLFETCVGSISTLEDSLYKMLLGKLRFFFSCIISQNKAQINKNNYGTMVFMPKQVSQPKICSTLQKRESAQKAIDSSIAMIKCTFVKWLESYLN